MASQHSRRSRDHSRPEMSIGRYTRLDEIGRGSFATVYQGVHTVSLGSLSQTSMADANEVLSVRKLEPTLPSSP
jgi:serine/threonine protein kinase